MTPRERLTPKEIQIAILVWEGLTNREIGRIVGTSEQVIKNHLRSIFDKLGVWSRLELAMYVAAYGGKNWAVAENTPLLEAVGAYEASLHRTSCKFFPSAEATLQELSRNEFQQAAYC